MYDADWPAAPGTYVLLMRLASPVEIQPGALGTLALPAGDYAYVGSARGPGGLRARIARHLRAGKRFRWHVDYLRAVAEVTDVFAGADAASRECIWLKTLLALPGSGVPVPRFGSSDCREGCPAHLVRLPDGWRTEEIAERLRL